MPMALDPLWEYGEPENGTNRNNLNCKLCGLHMIGGVYRLKYHLAKISGHDVGPCSNVSPEIMRLAHDSINSKERKKEEAAPKRAEFATFKATQGSGISASATKGSGRGSTATDSPVGGRIPSFFIPRTGAGAQSSIKSVVKKGAGKKQAG